MDRCRLCHRRIQPESEYCEYHSAARDNLVEAYERWKAALTLEWSEFLREVSELKETGSWVLEVAADLLRES